MSEALPKGWLDVQLGDICLPVSQRGPDKARASFRYVDLGALDNKAKRIREATTVESSLAPSRAKQVIKSGDVVFSTVRVYLENIALVPPELDGQIASTAFCVLRPASGIDPRFLYYFVTSRRFIVDVNDLQRGNSPPSVQDGDVRGRSIPLAPKAEQSRIASKIDELFSRIEEGERALERVQKLVERYRQSVLKAAVMGELTREWRETHRGQLESGQDLLDRVLKARREAWEQAELDKMKAKGIRPADDHWKETYRLPAAPDTTDLPELPEGWAWASVEQLCSEFGNGLSRKPANEPPGVPILRISAVRSRAVDSGDVRYYVADARESLHGFEVHQGDLLFTRYNGSRELVGVSGVFKGSEPVLHPDKLIRARVAAKEHIHPDYLAICMNSGASWRHVSRWVKTSAGQHGIAGSDIKRAPVPLAPSREQQRIVDLVEAASSRCDEGAAACAEQMRRSQALRQVTLRFAFTGRLVPQDPAAEPAAALLERIAAERGQSGAARRGRKVSDAFGRT